MQEIAELKNLDPIKQQAVLKDLSLRMNLVNLLFHILGFKDLNKVHKDLCDFMDANHLFKMVLMPRYSFKSTICTIGYSIYRLMKNPDMRILIYSDASSKAEAFLSSIKDHIEGKVRGGAFHLLFKWFPNSKNQTWNMSQIVISGRQTSFPEASVDTGGIETSKVGKHYDLIIFDDIVSDQNITTKEQMDKVSDCYKRSLSKTRDTFFSLRAKRVKL